jgi:hypothetical protein
MSEVNYKNKNKERKHKKSKETKSEQLNFSTDKINNQPTNTVKNQKHAPPVTIDVLIPKDWQQERLSFDEDSVETLRPDNYIEQWNKYALEAKITSESWIHIKTMVDMLATLTEVFEITEEFKAAASVIKARDLLELEFNQVFFENNYQNAHILLLQILDVLYGGRDNLIEESVQKYIQQTKVYNPEIPHSLGDNELDIIFSKYTLRYIEEEDHMYSKDSARYLLATLGRHAYDNFNKLGLAHHNLRSYSILNKIDVKGKYEVNPTGFFEKDSDFSQIEMILNSEYTHPTVTLNEVEGFFDFDSEMKIGFNQKVHLLYDSYPSQLPDKDSKLIHKNMLAFYFKKLNEVLSKTLPGMANSSYIKQNYNQNKELVEKRYLEYIKSQKFQNEKTKALLNKIDELFTDLSLEERETVIDSLTIELQSLLDNFKHFEQQNNYENRNNSNYSGLNEESLLQVFYHLDRFREVKNQEGQIVPVSSSHLSQPLPEWETDKKTDSTKEVGKEYIQSTVEIVDPFFSAIDVKTGKELKILNQIATAINLIKNNPKTNPQSVLSTLFYQIQYARVTGNSEIYLSLGAIDRVMSNYEKNKIQKGDYEFRITEKVRLFMREAPGGPMIVFYGNPAYHS